MLKDGMSPLEWAHPCSGISAGQGSRLRESKIEELHCYQGTEAS